MRSRGWRPGARDVVLATLFGGSILACEVLAGIGDDPFTVAPPASPPDAGDAGDGCLHAGPPGRPDASDSPPDFADAIVFAVRSLDFSGADGGGLVGFDLDGVCTCSPQAGAASCVRKQSLTPACDGDGGVDNAATDLAQSFAGLDFSGKLGTAFFAGNTENVACGSQTQLFVLSRYNGLPNDPSVVVAGLHSTGIRESTLDAGASDCGAGQFPARFDASDLWSVPPDALKSRSPLAVNGPSVEGYVRDSVLVFDSRQAAGESTLSVLFGSGTIEIGTPIMTARLIPLDESGQPLPDDGGSAGAKPAAFRIDEGVIAGRLPSRDLLTLFGGTPYGDAGAPVCDNLTVMSVITSQVCGAVDVVSSRDRDFKGDACDALSIAFKFAASPASVGSVDDRPMPTVRCDASCRP